MRKYKTKLKKFFFVKNFKVIKFKKINKLIIKKLKYV